MKRAIALVLLLVGCVNVPSDPDNPESKGGVHIDIDAANPDYVVPVAQGIKADVDDDGVATFTWAPNKTTITAYTCSLRSLEDPARLWTHECPGETLEWSSDPLDDGAYEFYVIAREATDMKTPADSLLPAPFSVHVISRRALYLYPRVVKVAPQAEFSVWVRAANFEPDQVNGLHLPLVLPDGIEYRGWHVLGFLKEGSSSIGDGLPAWRSSRKPLRNANAVRELAS